MDWLLESLTEVERVAVFEATRRCTFAKGEVVFQQGDSSDSVHVVISGHLAVSVSTLDGAKAMLNVLGPGAHVGELALLGRSVRQPRSATVVALEPTVTRELSAVAFHRLCMEHSGVERLLLEMMADRIRELSSRLVEALYLGLDRRLYRTLLRLADLYRRVDAETVIPLTEEEITDLVGGTRPSVNQVLQRLADQAVLELGSGQVTIKDLAALSRKAEDG